jgi:hypothetical protein
MRWLATESSILVSFESDFGTEDEGLASRSKKTDPGGADPIASVAAPVSILQEPNHHGSGFDAGDVVPEDIQLSPSWSPPYSTDTTAAVAGNRRPLPKIPIACSSHAAALGLSKIYSASGVTCKPRDAGGPPGGLFFGLGKGHV